MNRQISENTPNRSSRSFLQRFQGRTSTIGKAGLLSLLQGTNSPNKNSKQGIQRYMQQVHIKPRKIQNKYELNQFNVNKLQESEKRSSNQSFRTEPRRSSMGSMANLGTTNRSHQKNSGYQHKFALNVPIMSSAELKNERKPNLISMNNSQSIKKYGNLKTDNDDKFKHLEFLNLFEERMKKRQKK